MSKAPLWMAALRVVFAILILIALGGLVFSYISGDPLSESRTLRTLVQVVVLGYFVVQPYVASRQLIQRLSAGSQTMMGVITPLGVTYRDGAGNQIVEYPWNSYYHIYKADGLIVLSTAESRISIFPSSLFKNEQDWNNFLEYVDSRVRPVK